MSASIDRASQYDPGASALSVYKPRPYRSWKKLHLIVISNIGLYNEKKKILPDFPFVFQPTQWSMERTVCISLDSFWQDLLASILSTGKYGPVFIIYFFKLPPAREEFLTYPTQYHKKFDQSCPVPPKDLANPRKFNQYHPLPLTHSLQKFAQAWPLVQKVVQSHLLLSNIWHHTHSERWTSPVHSCIKFGQSSIVPQKIWPIPSTPMESWTNPPHSSRKCDQFQSF